MIVINQKKNISVDTSTLCRKSARAGLYILCTIPAKINPVRVVSNKEGGRKEEDESNKQVCPPKA